MTDTNTIPTYSPTDYSIYLTNDYYNDNQLIGLDTTIDTTINGAAPICTDEEWKKFVQEMGMEKDEMQTVVPNTSTTAISLTAR